MYIAANLPPFYGQFKKIQRDNYPFSVTFVSYLEAIARLGLELKMDVDLLVGVIEDSLLKEDRLPDIPEGNEPVKFRFSTDSKIIQEYFDGSSLTNKKIILLIIRTTLRLSERFGTSLARLTRMVAGLGTEETVIEPIKREPKPKVRLVKQPVKEREIEPETASEPEEENDVLKRLEALTEKGDKLLSEGEAGETVVTTNPFLNDFL